MRIAIAQINPTVGGLSANAEKIFSFTQKAKSNKADLVVFPELALTGYPPEDLLLKPSFINDNISALKELAKKISGINAIIGFVDKSGGNLYNAAAFIADGKIKYVYHKMILPNYGVFDEKRYFCPGTQKPKVFKVQGVPVGINICEDIWIENGPAKALSKAGAKVIVAINASPYHVSKVSEREIIIRRQAVKNKTHIIYCNLVGGQDEIVFDGYSMAVNPKGKVIARADGFGEELLTIDIDPDKPANIAAIMPEDKEVYNALLTGLKDYVTKNGFKDVVIGLSGGIDSAIVATLAADALGKEHVHCVFMPSRYSSIDSREDAEEIAKNLGIDYHSIPIEELFGTYSKVMTPFFKNTKPDITEENLQARIRGNLLMALSNKFGWLVLTTGNKSEMRLCGN